MSWFWLITGALYLVWTSAWLVIMAVCMTKIMAGMNNENQALRDALQGVRNAIMAAAATEVVVEQIDTALETI